MLLLAAVLILSNHAAWASPISVDDKDVRYRSHGRDLEYIIDKDDALTPQEVLRTTGKSKNSHETPNLGLTKLPIWVKFRVTNHTSSDRLMIYYPVSYVTTISYYDSTEFGHFEPSLINGVNLSHAKVLQDPGYHFNLFIQPGETRTVLFRLKADQQILLGYEVGTETTMRGKHWSNSVILYGMFIGILLVMILYNLVIYFVTRINLYLYYVVYVTFSLLAQSSLLGIYQTFFPLLGEKYNYMAMYLFVVCVALSGNFFVIRFINIKENMPRFKWAYYGVNISYVVTGIFILAGKYLVATVLLQANAFYCAVLILWCSFYIGFWKKDRSAQILFVAWLVFMGGLILYVLKDFGLVPLNWFTTNIVAVGTALETVLLSLALADLINRMREESQLSLNRVFLEEQKNANLKLRLKRSELASLQGQMNPHFVFNALSSIQNDILKEDLPSAYSSIGQFAQLMRKGLEHSRASMTSLQSEMSFLKNYMELEQKRFASRFSFEVEAEPQLLKDDVNLPPLMIQPICENAIKHGFNNDSNGLLSVRFSYHGNDAVLCVVEDNGVGIKKSSKNKVKKSDKKSYGLAIVEDRIRLFTEQDLTARMTVTDLSEISDATGTRVELVLPIG